MSAPEVRKAAAGGQAAFLKTSDHKYKSSARFDLRQETKPSIIDGLQLYRSIFNRSGYRSLDRQSLPTPLQYLTEHGLLKRRPRGEWAAIRCPIHKGGVERNPSLSVSLVDGHFRCHACGAKGGDIIALHRLITRLGFVEAVRDLGGGFHE